MTRDEAIKILKPILFLDKDKDEALNMVIEALERKRGKWIDGLDVPILPKLWCGDER